MNQLLFFVMTIFSILPILSPTEAKISGFSIDLIHRDSPLSPFYNSSITPSEVLANAVLRSISRLNHFSLSSMDEKSIESVVIPNINIGDYLMELSIGTPPIKVFAVADTGSDLIWIKCMSCLNCNRAQNSPIFDPAKSSTYRELSCGSKPCTELLNKQDCSQTNKCEYYYSYEDKSFTKGELSSDTFILGSTNGRAVAFPSSVFGCGLNNSDQFTGLESGLVGLGGGPLSLISQLGAKNIERKFTYCLVPHWYSNSTSKLRFGEEATISGEGIVSTPLISKSDPTFYYLTLEGISIGEKTVTTTSGEGNIIIDSGTTLTMLETSLYKNLEAIVKEAIHLKPVEDPPAAPFKLCYATASGDGLPDMIFHFSRADLHLKPLNTFVKIKDSEYCLSMVPSDSLSIFGNLVQVNFQVEYNLEGKNVNFAPTDCTK